MNLMWVRLLVCIFIILFWASGCKVLFKFIVAYDADIIDSADFEDGAGGSVSCPLCCVGKFDCTDGSADTVCMYRKTSTTLYKY